jgi:protein TonB
MFGRRRLRRKAFGISIAIESAALATLLIVPLMTSIAQPIFSKTSTVPFIFGGAHIHRTETSHPISTKHAYQNFTSLAFNPPPRVPVRSIDYEEGMTMPGWEEAEVGLQGFDPPPFSNIHITESNPPSLEINKSQPRGPIRVIGSVEQAQLISRIEPRYPALALQTKKEGAVILHAIISRDGRITALDIVSGSPLLVTAALDAVRQWRYRPTLLNGDPVEVETTITVIFRLQQ